MTRTRDSDRPDTLSLIRTPGGGFRLAARNGIAWTARAAAYGWNVGGAATGRLMRYESQGTEGGFVFVRGKGPAGPEAACSLRSPGAAAGCGTHLLAEDGRLFRIEPGTGRERTLALSSWEVPGAYWTAQAGPRAWRVTRTIAGRALADEEAILLLFAAEIVAAQGPEIMRTRKRRADRDARRA